MSLYASTSSNTDYLTIPESVPSSDSDDEIISDNRALAFLVYKGVWDEFNKWKEEDSKQQLRLLEQPLPTPNIVEATKRMASTFHTDDSEPDDVEIIYICDTEDDIPLDVGGATVLTCSSVSLMLPPNFLPHPPYESCTPSVQTIAPREDEHEALFVPYADDPTWNVKGYLHQYASFSWEKLVDPDGRPFQLELTSVGSYIYHLCDLRCGGSGGNSIRSSSPIAFWTWTVPG